MMAATQVVEGLCNMLIQQSTALPRDVKAIGGTLAIVYECVKKVDDEVYDVVAAPGGIMEVIAKNDVMGIANGGRGDENVINYAWFIAVRLKLQGADREKVKMRRHAIIRYGWLDLAAKELDFSFKSGKILPSALNAGNYLWTLCDKEEHAAEIVASPCLPIIIPLVVKYKAATGDKGDFKMLRNMFQCIYNSARWDPCRPILKAYPELVHLCEELTRHPSKEISLLAAFTICLVSGRDESGAGQDLLKRSPNIISDTITVLDRVIDAGEGAGVDGLIWDPEELTRILRNISISDANKKVLNPVVPVLIKAMKGRPENVKMNKEILTTFLQLSFEPTTAKTLQESISSIEQAIAGIATDADDVVQIKALMSRLKPDGKSQRKQSAAAPRRASGDVGGVIIGGDMTATQLLISCDKGSKETMSKIQSALVQANYRVWLDSEQISGSSDDKMAEAVESADIILVCVTSSYKESANCRHEAEYALACQKPLVVLILEKNYKANGWLGLLMKQRPCVDCTDPNNPNISGVIREVSRIASGGAATATAGAAAGGDASETNSSAAFIEAIPVATIVESGPPPKSSNRPKKSGGGGCCCF